MRRVLNEAAREEIQQLLTALGFTHLGVLSRGRYLVIYAEEGGEKMPRLRFGRIDQGRYALDMANHRGGWEPTPFTGTLAELFSLVTEQFGWVLLEL
ncbi:hypothetical protein [Geochorda subterranea]|uniref:Uncharacterized protein n=1 Tax=Geochorda subterranea TaxID=3109564 RepID=A0ABZ1BSG7_9FIRM|nr:hypothetical protein [Limnochorda sp. LNt]WRP15775.1 hypothetical protein VLY81_06370 [Limnochorda sp. LNt]